MKKTKAAKASIKRKKTAPKRADVVNILSATQLKKHKSVKAPKVKRMKRDKLTALAGRHTNQKVALSVTPVMELSAQHPFDNAGNMDFYKPGRWDTSINLVFMDVIVSGPLPGEWDGTAGYVRFQAPAEAMYVIFAYFTGYQITMRLNGPWGIVESSTATTSDTGLALAVWSGSAGDNLYFTIDCVGPLIGYLESIQVYEVTF